MEQSRLSGLLLHPTSLPGPYGIGDLGSQASHFVGFLHTSGQRLWQILPLGPTGFGNSPYQTYSAFAGNPLLLSLERLREEGWLSNGDLEEVPSFPPHRVDYEAVKTFKERVLWKAFENVQDQAFGAQDDDLAAFIAEHHEWLEDYAFFMALKEAHQGLPWNHWDQAVARRDPEALAGWRQTLAPRIRFHQFLQFHFFRQWQHLKDECHDHGIQLFGDAPIFVAHDSADVWAHPELFYLDEEGNPTVVAGVPPDYFSRTGQLWGNPLYRWEVMATSDFAWWMQRLRTTQQMVDIIRLDHFRGFEAYWEVPATELTAVNGRWVQGPGLAFFETLRRTLGDLPIVAEDLGLITPEVRRLRVALRLPGMRVLQFGFGGDPCDNEHAPHNYSRDCVVYTGTHDNNTTRGWLDEVDQEHPEAALDHIRRERAVALKYLASDGRHIHWDMIRMAFASVADVAVIPLQDVFGLGQDARMNYPGRAEGNWEWRYTADMLNDSLATRLRDMVEIYGRMPPPPER